MNISFDAQPLIDGQKTGVGFCEAGIIKALLKTFPSNQYFFEYFSFSNKLEKKAFLNDFVNSGGIPRECWWFPGRIYRALWNFIPISYSLFFGKKTDLTHFFNYHIPPGVGGKRVATVHDMAYKVFPETVRFKTKLMLNLSLQRSCARAHKIITISEFSKNEIIKYMGIPESKITVSHCGVDHDVFRSGIEKDEIGQVMLKYNVPCEYFLYMGTLEPRKNIERLIEAYAALKKEIPNAPALVLAGRKGWLYNSILKRVSNLKLTDYVLFTGYVEEADKTALLSGALAFAFPSLYEGFGMPPLEAMACGTPVLTSNVSSLPEVVGDAAVLVNPYSIAEITIGLKRLFMDEDLRKQLSEKGIRQAEQFTWERSAEIIMRVYRELVEDGCEKA